MYDIMIGVSLSMCFKMLAMMQMGSEWSTGCMYNPQRYFIPQHTLCNVIGLFLYQYFPIVYYFFFFLQINKMLENILSSVVQNIDNNC